MPEETSVGFVHPSKFGMNTPINSQKELVNLSKIINAGTNEILRKEGFLKKEVSKTKTVKKK